MTRRRWGGVLCALGTLLLVAACSSDGAATDNTISTADAYNATIRWYLDMLPAPVDTTKVKPAVVYVAPASGKPIDVQTQADVAKEMADMDDVVVVRFADVRDDALDVDLDNQPVKDDGVLLLVSDVEPGKPPLQMNVGVYRNAEDETLYSVTVLTAGSVAQATPVTEVPQG